MVWLDLRDLDQSVLVFGEDVLDLFLYADLVLTVALCDLIRQHFQCTEHIHWDLLHLDGKVRQMDEDEENGGDLGHLGFDRLEWAFGFLLQTSDLTFELRSSRTGLSQSSRHPLILSLGHTKRFLCFCLGLHQLG